MNFPIHQLKKSEFPNKLREIPEPPKELYIRGEIWNPESKLLCVVGSRSHTPYGKQALESIISGLAGEDIIIVSGLALGIDTLAHKAAMAAGLKTIAVPGSGLGKETMYPRANLKLASEILHTGGALLSEFPEDAKSQLWMFPKRNRIMAGLCDAVLIIEAEIKSGTLITARLATDYNRDVLTVPGSIFSSTTEGPHMLMRLGATPVRNAADVLEALHIVRLEGEDVSAQKYKELSDDEKKIIDALSSPTPKDDLITSIDLPIHEIQGLLMMLEIKGMIKEEYGEIRRV